MNVIPEAAVEAVAQKVMIVQVPSEAHAEIRTFAPYAEVRIANDAGESE